jgi:methylmalonyl-CoA mutase N-terminal domain/subunit
MGDLSYDIWFKTVYQPGLKRNAERQASFVTSDGTSLNPVYSARENPSYPGEYPYVRGIHSSMYRSRLWTMRQYAGFGDAHASNQRYRHLLQQGQTGLSVAFDLPTQMGFDSDAPQAEGEVGKVGVAIDSVEDMDILLKDIPLDRVSTSMTINSTAGILLCLYVAVAESRGVDAACLQGTVQNDILKEYMARGTYIYPPKPSMRLTTDLFDFCHRHVPLWNTVSVSGYHIREAGCTAVQEIAFTLSDGIAYMEAAREAGLHLDDIAPRVAFFFNVHNHFLEEVAKFRAARVLWAQLMRERFQVSSGKAELLRFHAQTAGSTLTAQQPHNNVVRVTLQALAAVLGGAQSLHTNGMDEALALPSEEAATLALRTQQIIAYETGVADTADPLGGSYVIEHLTETLVKKSFALIQHIDAMGGMVRAIEQGYPQKAIQDAAYAAYLRQSQGKDKIVGVNVLAEEHEKPIPLMRIDPSLEKKQKQRLQELKASRATSVVSQCLLEIEKAARSSDNVIPCILKAVKNRCTLGEISDVFRKTWGVHKETVV